MKICPETNSPVLYLDCLECETKTCKKAKTGQQADTDKENDSKFRNDRKHA